MNGTAPHAFVTGTCTHVIFTLRVSIEQLSGRQSDSKQKEFLWNANETQQKALLPLKTGEIPQFMAVIEPFEHICGKDQDAKAH